MRAARRPAAPAVRVASAGGVVRIVLGRGAAGNRLDGEMAAALAEACADVGDRDDVRVVVLDHDPPDFCLGLPAGCSWPDPAWPDAVAAVASLPQPVIAVVGGTAARWGLGLALACDLRVAAATATLRVDADAGFPGGGLTQRLPRLVGPARALELLLVGRALRGREAAAWGLATAVAPASAVRATADALARGLAARGPTALRYAKEAVVRALDLALDDGMRLEHDLYVLLQTTADRREGVAAFRARRPPRFRGR